MLPRLGPLLLVTALAGCRASSHASNQISTGAKVENATIADLNLTSDAFRDGQTIPSPDFTCEGGNRTPSLKWSDPPAGTKSFALVLDDPDAPSGTFRHWGVFDIPASARSIGGQQARHEATNDFGKPATAAPARPRATAPHHYHFKLFALDTERLGLSTNGEGRRCRRRRAAACDRRSGELVGTYERV